MSTLKTTNIAHPSSASNNIVLDSSGNVTIDAGTLYVDASNNRVGIGTTAPSDLNSNANQLVVGSGTGNQGLTVFAGSSSDSNIFFADGTTGAAETIGYIQYRHASDRFDFGTNDTTRMSIDSSGRLLVGTSSNMYPGYPFKLEVDGGSSDVFLAKTAVATAVPVASWNAATSGNNYFAYFYTETSPTPRGSIDYNRSAGQVRYNVTSDRRLKSDIADANSALNTLDQIKVRSYTWVETGYAVEYGFIAQELNETVPDAVKVGDDGDEVVDTWAVDNAKLVPLLTKALQEALSEIATLKDRVAALEAA